MTFTRLKIKRIIIIKIPIAGIEYVSICIGRLTYKIAKYFFFIIYGLFYTKILHL